MPNARNNALLAAAKPLVNAPIYRALLAAPDDDARRSILVAHGFSGDVAGLRAAYARFTR